MLISDGVEFGAALCGARAADKQQALQLVASGLARIAGFPAATVLTALVTRESLGSTGIGQGVALPHARLEGVPCCCRLVMRLARPVDFEAIDDRPVDLIVGVLSRPDDATAPRLLSGICRLLRNPEATAVARRSTSEEELRAALALKTMGGRPHRLATLSY